MNLDALEPVSYADPLPSGGGSEFIDADGLLIPDLWRYSPRWAKLPLATRRSLSEGQVARDAKAAAKKDKPRRAPATRYTTDYAVRLGRERGWKLVDRERYDHKNRHHYDLQLGVDALFDDGQGLVGVQGAGVGERAEHRRRFDERGGPEVAARRHIRVLYVEFTRGNTNPTREEWWA